MEQVFELVNVLLDRDRETKRRDLLIRTYKVIPLSSMAGILEFVPNTCPLRNWLDEATRRYKQPHEIDLSTAASKARATYGSWVKQRGHVPSMLIPAFRKLSPLVPAVMHHWFVEQHKLPIEWFKARLKYTRSAATTSIVGYSVGLGDRHTSNILIDNSTGELVHIDLGVAFGAGTILPVPERVPFRLTKNMVDGMGTSGTDGVFQRCSEETLRVLRKGKDVIMTILEVFRHDPLHSWAMSEYRAAKVQGQSNTGQEEASNDDLQNLIGNQHLGVNIALNVGSAEEQADRALGDVNSRLDPSLSVSATVSGLIAEARDVENLGSMYHGTSPLGSLQFG